MTLDFQSIIIITTIVMNTALGIIVLSRWRKEFVNLVYVVNVAAGIWWSAAMIAYRLADTHLVGWTMNLYVAPTVIASSFVYLAFLFPTQHPKIPLKPLYVWAIALFNALVIDLTIMPGLIIEGVDLVPHAEKIIHFGPLYLVYASYITLFFGIGLLILARKMVLIQDPDTRRKLAYLFGGYMAASTFAMVTNLTLPYLGYFALNWVGQACTALMVLPVTYAIFKLRLFNVRVIGVELITISIWLVLVIRTLLDVTLRDLVIDITLLATMLFIGILLMRSVRREVAQRELIERQEKGLEVANKQQEVLLHFISHEIKGYLTKGEAAFAEIVEDGSDATPKSVRDLAATALVEMRKGVDTVMNILDASDLRRGTVRYKKDPMNFRTIVESVVGEKRPMANEKKLGIDVHITDGVYDMLGDAHKLREHVIENLIDNAINYTPSGKIVIKLSDGNGKIRFEVHDSGVGITPEDMAHLFTEGGHGKDSIKVNVHSTGYGLFIAKQVVDAHGGRIWAESDGAGKGARFIVELTVHAQAANG